MKTEKIVFLSPYDPRNVFAWSGTLTSLYQALVNHPAGLQVSYIDVSWLDAIARAINRMIRSKIDCRLTTPFAIIAGIFVSLKLAFIGDATIVAVIASNYVPYLITSKPIIYISDTTFRAIVELYPYFQNMPKWLQRQFDRNESRTLEKSRYLIYPSQWACASAKSHYGIPQEKIFELPFGPNIPDNIIQQRYSPKSAPTDEVRILFISADWKRKDGDKAIEVCRCLIRCGINARLIVIGVTPKDIRQIHFIEDKGFLQKSDPQQLGELCDAYRDAHFFILPTMADASPIVFSESRAFGLPPITYDVGGTGSGITHRRDGLLLPLGAPPEQFAEELMRYIRDPSLYEELSRNCREWYVEKAQWKNWAELILQLMQEGPTDGLNEGGQV